MTEEIFSYNLQEVYKTLILRYMCAFRRCETVIIHTIAETFDHLIIAYIVRHSLSIDDIRH